MEILTCLKHLAKGWLGARYSVEAYVEDLSDLGPETLWRACQELRRTAEKFFPTIGEIRATCERMSPRDIPAYHQRFLPERVRDDVVPAPAETKRIFAQLRERTAREQAEADRANGGGRSLEQIRRTIQRTKPEDEAAWQAYSRRVLDDGGRA
jgi:hypothetical protein